MQPKPWSTRETWVTLCHSTKGIKTYKEKKSLEFFKTEAVRTRQYNWAKEHLALWWASGSRSTETDKCAEHDILLRGRLWNSLKDLVAKISPKRVERQPFICGYCTTKKTAWAKLSNQTFYVKVFVSIAKNESTVPRNELTPTAVNSICSDAQAQTTGDNNIILIGLSTGGNYIAALTLQKWLVSRSGILPSKIGDSAKTTST